jgi:carbon monoxide dehydrogenase subunit G
MKLAASYRDEFRFAEPPHRVWPVLADVSRHAAMLDGVESAVANGDRWRWILRPGGVLGLAARSATTVRYELTPRKRLRFVASAEQPGDNARGEGQFHLQSDANGTRLGLELRFEVEIVLPRLLAPVGSRILDEQIRRMANAFVEAVRASVR